MLKGYDQTKAVELILDRMNPEDYAALSWQDMPSYLTQCIEADFDYMLARDIMRKDGSDGDSFYNKESAFFHIAATLLKKNSFGEAQLQEVYTLVDDYMDYNRSYLQLNGLRYHEDDRLLTDDTGW